MNRDLVFFIAGLCFGIVGGYFVPVEAPGSSVSRSARTESSQIGLEPEPQFEKLDEDEVARLEAEAESRPKDARPRARLGSLYLDAGRFGEAVTWLERARELEPSDLHVRNHLALSYLNMGSLEDAVATYEETLRIEPSHPPSLLGLGRIKLYLQQDIDGGLAMWERLMAEAPGSVEAESVRDELEALKSAHPGS